MNTSRPEGSKWTSAGLAEQGGRKSDCVCNRGTWWFQVLGVLEGGHKRKSLEALSNQKVFTHKVFSLPDTPPHFFQWIYTDLRYHKNQLQNGWNQPSGWRLGTLTSSSPATQVQGHVTLVVLYLLTRIWNRSYSNPIQTYWNGSLDILRKSPGARHILEFI